MQSESWGAAPPDIQADDLRELCRLCRRASLRDDPILGHFHLVHTAKREEKLHRVLRRIRRDLADDSTHGVGNRGVEDDLAPPACRQDSLAPDDCDVTCLPFSPSGSRLDNAGAFPQETQSCLIASKTSKASNKTSSPSNAITASPVLYNFPEAAP